MTNGEKLVKVFPDIELYKKMHGGIQIDFDSAWWNAEYQESTTKNDLGVDCRSLEDIKKLVERKADALDGVMLDAGGVIIGLYFAIANDLPSVTPQLTSELEKNSKKLDCISRVDVLNNLANIAKVKAKSDAQKSLMGRCLFMVENMPSVTPQEPKSEWEHDHEILKAYSNGANEVLDKIRAEIEKLQKMCDKNDLNLMAQYSAFGMVLDILDKYKAETEAEDVNVD